jgi:hypothetical protein
MMVIFLTPTCRDFSEHERTHLTMLISCSERVLEQALLDILSNGNKPKKARGLSFIGQ